MQMLCCKRTSQLLRYIQKRKYQQQQQQQQQQQRAKLLYRLTGLSGHTSLRHEGHDIEAMDTHCHMPVPNPPALM